MAHKSVPSRSVFQRPHAALHDVVPLLDGVHVLVARQEAVAAPAGVLEKWDVADERCVAVFRGHTGAARTVALAFDGTHAVSTGDDHTLRLWEVTSGACRKTLDGIDPPLAVLENGRQAVAITNLILSLVDLASGRIVKSFPGHTGPVTAVALVPGGEQFLSASRDRTLRLWDLRAAKCVRCFAAEPAAPPFAPDSEALDSLTVTSVRAFGSRQAVSAHGDGSLRCWNLDTGEVTRKTRCGDVWLTSLACAADGGRVLAGAWDRIVRVWEPATNKLTILGRHDGEVSAVAYLADGRRAISCSFDETLRIWDVANRTCLSVLGEPRESGLCPPNRSLW